MTSDRSAAGGKSAESIYRERANDGPVDIDALCREFPDHEHGLRLAHTAFQPVEVQQGSAASDETTSVTQEARERVEQAVFGEIEHSRIGEIVGKYRLVQELGRGGMGVVYLAREDGAVHRVVAVKLLPDLVGPIELVKRFEKERSALAGLNHDGICKLFDAGQSRRGEPYFAMERVEGDRLTPYCEKHELTIWDRLDLFARICDAVGHAHKHGVIHRDLKPDNILVRRDGATNSPKIIDFGLAKLKFEEGGANSLRTAAGQVMGTFEYMSPEQARMTERGIDQRTDVYSLGVILYELCTGVVPISFEQIVENGDYAGNIERIDPPPPSIRVARGSSASSLGVDGRRTLARVLRGDLDTISLRAIDKIPSYRYPDANELAADVRRFLKDQPVVAKPHTTLYRFRKFLRRHRVATWTTALGLAVAIVVGVGSFALARARQVAEANALLDSAGEALSRFRSARDDEGKALADWTAARESVENWRPPWERQSELELWRRIGELRRESEERYSFGTRSTYQALQLSREDSPERERARALLADLNLALYEEATRRGGINLSREYFRAAVEQFGDAEARSRLSVDTRVRFRCEPADAELFLFRYVPDEFETRLVPVPFDPFSKGSSGRTTVDPELVVERVWKSSGEGGESQPFRAGDIVEEIDGVQVSSLADLSQALLRRAAGRPLQVTLRRDGMKTTVAWSPLPFGDRGPPDTLVDPYRQLGLTFEANRMEFGGASLVKTRDREFAELALPPGSYLFVAMRAGCLPARYPLAFPGAAVDSVTLRLFESQSVPDGYVHIPAGEVATGGDSAAFQAEDWGRHVVDGFFLSRFEVTIAEWLAFVNDEEVAKRTDAEGFLAPSDPDVLKEIQAHGFDGIELMHPDLIGTGDDGLWSFQDGKWRFRSEAGRLDWPVFGVSYFAAVEFSRWKSRRAREEGKPWSFRLPTDREWERAARGTDRRIYAWGDYPMWSYCSSGRGQHEPDPRPVGSVAHDESVFGVRDMTGSCSEATSSRPLAGHPGRSRRGGDWDSIDDLYFRLASRNTLFPESMKIGSGFRLVATLTSP